MGLPSIKDIIDKIRKYLPSKGRVEKGYAFFDEEGNLHEFVSEDGKVSYKGYIGKPIKDTPMPEDEKAASSKATTGEDSPSSETSPVEGLHGSPRSPIIFPRESTPDPSDVVLNPASTSETSLSYFYAKLGSIMKDNMYDREVSGYRSGKLNNTKLHKVFSGSERVFTRKQERLNKSYNILLLLDESGSMRTSITGGSGGIYSMLAASMLTMPSIKRSTSTDTDKSKLQLVMDLAVVLIKGLGKNNINTSVIGYSEIIDVHKSFNTDPRIVDFNKLREDMNDNCSEYGGCNHDTFAVSKAIDEFKKVKNGKNITVIFSDGCPACDCSDDGADIPGLRKAVKELEKVSEVITVGIGTSEVEEYYPNCIVVNNEKEFMSSIIRELDQRIKRG